MSLDFYVSTTAFRRVPAEEVIARAQAAGLALEFSSGIPFRADMETIFLQAPLKRIPHNYFPAPATPFVLNLASRNPAVLQQSISHCEKGLELATKAGSPFFSVHAGYCLDPAPSDLGRPLQVRDDFHREEHLKIFFRAVRGLLTRADALGVGLLIENNVLAPFNLSPTGRNPLLCVTAEECLQLIGEIPHPRLGLLVDTGHLKVSALTLGFDARAAARLLAPHVRCVHHSDNPGTEDSNERLSQGYWFLGQMPAFAHAVHILEVHDLKVAEILEQKALLEASLVSAAAVRN